MDIQDTHKRLLDLIRSFDEICKQNQINYTLHGGTLLGAIREHGFIPWDDDMDIAMTRDDYNRLQNVLTESAPAYHIRGNIKKQFCRTGDETIWVDIFICDYISEKKLAQKTKLMLLTALDIMSRDRESMKLSNLSKYSKKKQIAYKLLFWFGRIVPKHAKTNLYADVSENRFLGSKAIMQRSNDQYKGRSEVFPAEWMSQYRYVQFESIMLPVIHDSHDLLVKCYGADYMTPIREDRNAEVHNLIRDVGEITL